MSPADELSRRPGPLRPRALASYPPMPGPLLELLPMSTALSDELRWHVAEKTDDPEVRKRQEMILDWFLDVLPERRHALREEGAAEGAIQGELRHARKAVRKVLVGRGIALTPEDEARLDACTDRSTLDRWLDQAVVAATTAEALR